MFDRDNPLQLPPGVGLDRRRGDRQQEGALQLRVRRSGPLGWFRAVDRPLLDCNRFGLAYESARPPAIGDQLLLDLVAGDWRLQRVPGQVRTVDRLVRDFRVGIEFVLDDLSDRRASRVGAALRSLDPPGEAY